MPSRGKLARLALLAVSSGLLFGVDLGSIGAAIHPMAEEIAMSTLQTESVVSGAKGGAVGGCLLGGALMSSRGRRFTVAVSVIPFVIGPIFLIFATSFAELLLGRLLMGFGIGLASVAAPNYLSEVVPPALRGIFEAMYELGIALGMLGAASINLGIEHFDQHGGDCPLGNCWRYQAGMVPLGAAFPLLLAVLLVPESPRWLMSMADSDDAGLLAALEAIQELGRDGATVRLVAARGGTGPPTTTRTTDDLVSLWDERHEAAGSPLWSARTAETVGFERSRETRIKTRHVLLQTFRDIGAILSGAAHVPEGAHSGLLLAIAAAILNQACASTSLLVYTQHVLQEAGVSNRETQNSLSLAVVAAKALGVILGLMLVNRVGRRMLLGWGGALSALLILVLAVGAAYKNVAVLLTGMSGFVLVFYTTWGIGYWIVVVELTAAGGPRFSGASQSFATATLFATGWLTSLTFIHVISLGPYGLLIYAGVAVLMALFAAFLLPETSGRSLEECGELLQSTAAPLLGESSDSQEVSHSPSERSSLN
ncbi:unnamed protein product [Polarella glacialis]|uniref:Hexose transporter 1 n=1 Tax=Polarella glacialis TaxID=89957 RepID=A0A813HE85_POLGL|nr:unnamed protein product [Polarella glacialis]CAE8731167.1 unnamed protein product [Polarella glacialis]CAE8738010.1 unnamed protein product [Polarella glacialis]